MAGPPECTFHSLKSCPVVLKTAEPLHSHQRWRGVPQGGGDLNAGPPAPEPVSLTAKPPALTPGPVSQREAAWAAGRRSQGQQGAGLHPPPPIPPSGAGPPLSPRISGPLPSGSGFLSEPTAAFPGAQQLQRQGRQAAGMGQCQRAQDGRRPSMRPGLWMGPPRPGTKACGEG